MLINELSQRTGVPIATLRYYESFGFFSGKADSAVKTNKYKQYDEEAVEKIEWIVQAKSGGFTLAEIKQWLNDWYSRKLSSARKLEIVKDKISEIDVKITQLKQVRKLLVDCIKDIENNNC